MDRRSEANSDYAHRVADGPSASVGGWTKTRPGSLGLLPSGPDPVGERYVLRQPPAAYVDHEATRRKGRSPTAPPGPRFTPPFPVPRPWHAQSARSRRPRETASPARARRG